MAEILRSGNIIIDRDRYSVWVGDEPIPLTYIEFEILATLTRNRGLVISRRQLLESVWGQDNAKGLNKLAVHVSRLRRKIAASRPWIIRTVRKRGYVLTDVSSGSRPTVLGRQVFSPSSSSGLN